MLNWFEVENFKSIKKLHLDVSPFMVLVGPNGAGKTNVVQALAMCLDILAERRTAPIELYGGYEQLIRRGKRPARFMRLALSASYKSPRRLGMRSAEPSVTTIASDIALHSRAGGVHVMREEVRIERQGHSPLVARWASKGPTALELGDDTGLYERLSQYNGASKERLVKALIARANALDPDMLRFPDAYNAVSQFRFTAPAMLLRLDASALRRDSHVSTSGSGRTLSLAGEGLPLAIERMRPPGKPPSVKFQRVMEGLRQVYPRIDDVKTIHYQPGRVALSFKEHAIGSEVGEANVSDGVMYALALLVALEGGESAPSFPPRSPNALIIEEPENALHPWALRKILERAQSGAARTMPLIITTHSPVVVDAVQDPASLFIVENDDKLGTTVTPALEREHALRAILAESGQKLGDVWLDGTLGGVPRAGA